MKKIFLIIIALFSLVGCSKDGYTTYKEIDYNEFQTKIEKKESFVLFLWQTDCSHCEAFKPTINEVIKEENQLIYAINLRDLSDSEYSKIENKTFIKGTPTVVYIKNGSVQPTKLVGNKSKNELKKFLKEYKLIK